MNDTVTIDRRFCGPTESGNGGYSCGLLAEPLPGDVEVTLRLPPPLDEPLVRAVDGDRARLLDGERVVAEARSTELDLDPPMPPSLDEATEAESRYAGLVHHAFPNCFVCGPGRGDGDGLRIFTGPLGRDGIVAGRWTPHASLADADGTVPDRFLWAAIDCAGSWAPEPRPAGAVVLGRMTARLRGTVRVGEAAIVIGWPIEVDGRKYHVGSALFDARGALLAVARATWIELRH